MKTKILKILLIISLISMIILICFLINLKNINTKQFSEIIKLKDEAIKSNEEIKEIKEKMKTKFTYDIEIKQKLDNINLTNINNLMIVAHPDDESIFGGSHLLNDNKYLVVCITCGTDKKRDNEFISIMNEYGTEYLLLGYLDSVSGIASDWGGATRYKMYRSLEEIMSYKNWNKIVTHNPEGDYKHDHHRMLSNIITDISNSFNEIDRLYYFGKYYDKKDIQLYNFEKIDKENLSKKTELIYKYYSSQKYACKLLEHIFPYENWIKAKEW